MARTIKLEIELDGATGAVSGIKSMEGAIVDLRKTGEKEGPLFGRAMETAMGFVVGNAVTQLQSRLAAIPGAIIDAGTAVQDQLADLSAITGIMGDDLGRLGNTAATEAMRTGVAARDQIEAYKLLASNIDITTIGGVDGLERLGRQTVTLSQAAKIDLSTAANVVAGSLNQWGASAMEAERFTNVLAAGSKFGAAEIGDLAESLKNAGTTAAQAGLEYEVTVGALEVMSQNTLKGAEAGTGLRNVLTILRTEAEKLAKAGISGVNLESDGLVTTLIKLKPLLGDAAALTEVFGRENLNAATILIDNAEAVATMTDKVTGTNTAQEQATVQMDTFSGSVARLTETINAIAVDTFDLFDDGLKDLIDTSIAFIEVLRSSGDEMAIVAKAVGVLAIAVGTYTAVTRASTIATAAQLAITKGYRIATIAVEGAIIRARAAQIALTMAMRSNPWGLALSAVTAIASAMIIFGRRTDETTDAIEDQREKVQALTADLETLQGVQLFGRYQELKGQLDELLQKQQDVALARLSMQQRLEMSQAREGDSYKALSALENERLALGERVVEVQEAIASAEARGADSLEFRRAQLVAQVDALVDQGIETEQLISKRKELAAVEEELDALRSGSSGTGESALTEKEAQAIRTRELQKRALQIELMEESAEKQLAMISLTIDQEIERYRQEYGQQFPELFEQLAEQLATEKQKLFDALASQAENQVPVPLHVPVDVQLEDEDVDFSFLDDAMRPLNGSIEAVNHNMAILRQRYAEAQSAGERWQISKQIGDLQHMQNTMQGLEKDFTAAATIGVNAFATLGTSIGESLASGKDAVEALGQAVSAMLGQMVSDMGRAMLQAAILAAAAGRFGKAARLTGAGTALIILGSVITSRANRQNRDSNAPAQSSFEDRPPVQNTDSGRRLAGFAQGGLVSGPGTGTSDSILARLSDGEFVVNARATRQHYPILASLNAGAAVESINAQRMGRIDQKALEQAVAMAVVKGVKNIPLEASGRSLKTVSDRQSELDSWAGKI